MTALMGSGEGAPVVELAMARVQAGVLSSQALVWALAASWLIVPTPVQGFTGDMASFQPLLTTHDGQTFLVVFTDTRRIGRAATLAKEFLQMTGRDVIAAMPTDVGIVVNPETSFCLELPWQGVAAIRDELRLPE